MCLVFRINGMKDNYIENRRLGFAVLTDAVSSFFVLAFLLLFLALSWIVNSLGQWFSTFSHLQTPK